ncbi:MAG: type IV pilus assembly protein PilM [Okeania sp. SIO2H7]|nr:type IV pilus assembly protein PilM [Okeania sp. SIO2H7]
MVSFLQKILGGRKPGFAVEITANQINLVELKKQGNQIKLATIASTEVPEDVFQEGQIVDAPAIAELIESLVEENNIKAKQVATAIPGREAVTRVIPVPTELNDAELQDYMNQEAGLYLPYPREEADVDYQKLGTILDPADDLEKVQVALVATRKEVTQTYIDIFTEAGLVIDILEVSNFALIRSVKNILQQYGPQEAIVIADLEFDSTELAIVVDGIPQFNRTIPIGTYQMQSALNEAMNLPPTRETSELLGMTVPALDTMGAGSSDPNPGTNALLKVLAELGDELRRSIDFYLNQFEELEVAQLLIAGPGSAIGQIDDFFMQRLSLPATKVDPIEELAIETDTEIPPEERSGLGIVLGLALREV